MFKPSDIRAGVFIILDGSSFEVIEYSNKKVARGGATIKVKLRNIETGSITEKTLKGNEKIEEADLKFVTCQFLYASGDDYFFMNNTDYSQFEINASLLGSKKNYLKEGGNVEVVVSEGKIIGVNLPLKVEFKVVEAQPGVKGDTATQATKEIVIETGYSLQAPLFIKEGDAIRIDTRDGKYVERVS
ncbi:elongation factor P [bacterium]|nr:elongation factor P [bacterium]